MKGKIFTLEEANKTLPLVRQISNDIRESYLNISKSLEGYEMAKNAGASIEEMLAADALISQSLDEFESLITEIESLGASVKDYENGYVDFYGEINGEIVYLCWSGEPEITYWHGLEDVANRKPIPFKS